VHPGTAGGPAGRTKPRAEVRAMAHNAKLEAADVVAAFDNQDDADEAVLGLRLAGFRDAQVGYLTRNVRGLVIDFAGRTYVAAGAATAFGPPLAAGDRAIYVAGAVCGAILLGITGAMCGWGVWRGEAVHPGSEVEPGRFVIAVSAGDHRDQAWAVIRRHGGYER